MPESPVSGAKFSKAPAAPKSLSLEDMQKAVTGQMQKAASILGGTVQSIPDAPEVKQLKSTASTIEVVDYDKRTYLRSLLAKEPFVKVYALFGDSLRVAFRTRRVKENEEISKLTAGDRHRLRMMTSLDSLEVGGSGQPMKPISINDLEDIGYSAVCQAFNEFESLCDELFRRANDPDFWTRTAGPI